MARDAERDLIFDGDYATAYRELIETATANALLDHLTSADTTRMQIAAEIRAGLTTGLIRTPGQPLLPLAGYGTGPHTEPESGRSGSQA